MLNKKLVHFNTYSAFELNKSNLYDWTIVFIKETKQIYTHGNFYDCNIANIVALQEELERVESLIPTKVSQLENDKNYIENCVSISYDSLIALKVRGQLIPGQTYAVYDYFCGYTQPITNEIINESASDFERIVVKATDEYNLAENVEVVRSSGYVPIVEARWTTEITRCPWTAGLSQSETRGVFYYMRDAFGNEADYDFKHIKFRRWALTDISPNWDLTTTASTHSPYRCHYNDNSPAISDERCRVGCGGDEDSSLIEGIFQGNWANSISDLAVIPFSEDTSFANGFHANYSTYCHKPYTLSTVTYDKYLAWDSDLSSTIGGTSNSLGALAKYSVLADDYCDMYTFSYNGLDASELGMIQNCRIGLNHGNSNSHLTNYMDPLPNTCIIISDQVSVTDGTTHFVKNMKINSADRTTMLLRPYFGLNVLIMNYEIHYSSRNLFIHEYVFHSIIRGTTINNYVNSDLICTTVDAYFLNNVIFGILQRITITGQFTKNLWYNAFRKLWISTASSAVSAKEGSYSYDSQYIGWTSYNILSPMIFGTIKGHHNTNTYRACYNKDVTMDACNSYNSFGAMAYSFKLDYGALQGAYMNLRNYACHLHNRNHCMNDYDVNSNGVHGWAPKDKMPPLYNISSLFCTALGFYVQTDWTELSEISSSVPANCERDRIYSEYTGYSNSVRQLVAHVAQRETCFGNYTSLTFNPLWRYADAKVSSSGTIAFTRSLRVMEQLCIIITNTGSSSITITLPSGSPYVRMSGTSASYTVTAGGYLEVNVLCKDESTVLIRASL